MAGRVASASPTRGWPVIGIAWLVGLVMGLVLASFAPWNGGGGLLAPPATPTPSATPTVPTATPPPTATPTDSPSPTDSPTLTPSSTPTPSPTLSPSPTPRVTPPPLGSVFGLAWFHKPPEDD